MDRFSVEKIKGIAGSKQEKFTTVVQYRFFIRRPVFMP
jgi:hypothetical protein